MNKLSQGQYWKSLKQIALHHKHHASINVIKTYSFHYFMEKYQPATAFRRVQKIVMYLYMSQASSLSSA